MKKFDIKSMIVGLIIGTIGVTSIFAAGVIKSATYSPSKVYFYGQEIPLKNSLVSIVKDGDANAQLYMPMRELFEYLQFNVEWNPTDSSVNLTMNGSNSNNSFPNNEIPSNITTNDADKEALDIIQKTGNWKYIEPYLDKMSPDGIKRAVDIYNSKHQNPAEHKKASEYITEAKSITDSEIKSQQNQVINIDIPKIEAGKYVVLDLCDIQGSDEITFDITSNGKGTLFVGFMKDKDKFGTTYFGNGDFYGEQGKIESTFKVNGFEGKYYFFVKNNGNEKMENIKGTVTLVSNSVKETENELQIQTIHVDVKAIEAKEFIELGEYNLSAGDNIHFNISATGKGLSIGFIKSTENVKTANIKYFAQTVSGENASIKNNNVTVPPEVAGYYKLYIQSVGENKLTNIKGTVEIIQSYVKTEKVETKKQEVQSENNTMSLGYKTIGVDILNADKAITTSAKTPLGDKHYYAFGPYSTPSNTDKVIIDIKNGADGDLFIATSSNKEMTDGVTNIYSTGSTYNGSIGIFDNNTGNYYVIIGAKDFKNLKGTIQIPIAK